MSDQAKDGGAAVISRYDVPAVKQRDLATLLEQAARDWIRKRPGFVSGTVHCSIDQLHIVAYTLWAREEDAINYMQCPEAKEFLLMATSSGARVRDSHAYYIGETVSPERFAAGHSAEAVTLR